MPSEDSSSKRPRIPRLIAALTHSGPGYNAEADALRREVEELRAERTEWREANAGLCALHGESREMIKGYREAAEKAEARVARVQAVADEWGEPYHCGWLSASVLVRQLRTALNDKETHAPDTD